MEKMEIDPKKIDFVFISHHHGDHTGGLAGILKIKPDLKVYEPESFSGSTQIVNEVWTTGPLGSSIKEQSLIINSEKGLIIITGCAHPGVINIIKKAKEMFPDKTLYLAMGGFHLSEASDSELKNIISDFRELGVQKVAPCHCSGEKCRELFKEEYKDDFIENGAGKIIEI
jgi:7,8-dihydropterin-6-yl-methyl-4-(beta-D-ribofuranosyl)aminobenzene 5'-phosphate synthase